VATSSSAIAPRENRQSNVRAASLYEGLERFDQCRQNRKILRCDARVKSIDSDQSILGRHQSKWLATAKSVGDDCCGVTRSEREADMKMIERRTVLKGGVATAGILCGVASSEMA